MLRGFGLMTAMVPINNVALGTLPPQRLKNASGLYNLTRNLGGAVGLALINTLINDRWDLHLARLHESVAWGHEQAERTLANLTDAFASLRLGRRRWPATKQLALMVRQRGAGHVARRRVPGADGAVRGPRGGHAADAQAGPEARRGRRRRALIGAPQISGTRAGTALRSATTAALRGRRGRPSLHPRGAQRDDEGHEIDRAAAEGQAQQFGLVAETHAERRGGDPRRAEHHEGAKRQRGAVDRDSDAREFVVGAHDAWIQPIAQSVSRLIQAPTAVAVARPTAPSGL